MFSIAFSAILFGLTSLFVAQDRITLVPVLIILSLLTMLWAACLAIALTVVVQPGSVTSLVAGVAIAAAAAGFLRLPAAIGAALLVLFLGLARRALYREANNRVLFRPSEVFLPGLRPLLFGASLAVVGLAWPVVMSRLTPSSFLLSPETVSQITTRLIPTLPGPLASAVDTQQVTALVTTTVNQYLQSLLATYRSVFLLIVLLAAISAWRAMVPFVAWAILLIIMALITLARQGSLMYLSRSQATIERLHL